MGAEMRHSEDNTPERCSEWQEEIHPWQTPLGWGNGHCETNRRLAQSSRMEFLQRRATLEHWDSGEKHHGMFKANKLCNEGCECSLWIGVSYSKGTVNNVNMNNVDNILLVAKGTRLTGFLFLLLRWKLVWILGWSGQLSLQLSHHFCSADHPEGLLEKYFIIWVSRYSHWQILNF